MEVFIHWRFCDHHTRMSLHIYRMRGSIMHHTSNWATNVVCGFNMQQQFCVSSIAKESSGTGLLVQWETPLSERGAFVTSSPSEWPQTRCIDKIVYFWSTKTLFGCRVLFPICRLFLSMWWPCSVFIAAVVVVAGWFQWFWFVARRYLASLLHFTVLKRSISVECKHAWH